MSSSSSPGSSSCEEPFYLQDMAQEADNPSSPLAKSTLAAVSTPSKTQDLNMHRLPYASHNSYSPFDICPSRENGFFEELETLGRNRKASKKPPKPRGPRFMWFRTQLFKPILLADYVSGVLWYNVLLLLQWCILHLMPRRWKEQRGYAHLFKYPHSEEGRKAEEEQARRSVEREEKRKNVRRLRTRSTLTKWTRVVFGLWLLVKRWFLWFWFPKQRPFIVFVDNLRRRCMTNPDKTVPVLENRIYAHYSSCCLLFHWKVHDPADRKGALRDPRDRSRTNGNVRHQHCIGKPVHAS